MRHFLTLSLVALFLGFQNICEAEDSAEGPAEGPADGPAAYLLINVDREVLFRYVWVTTGMFDGKNHCVKYVVNVTATDSGHVIAGIVSESDQLNFENSLTETTTIENHVRIIKEMIMSDSLCDTSDFSDNNCNRTVTLSEGQNYTLGVLNTGDSSNIIGSLTVEISTGCLPFCTKCEMAMRDMGLLTLPCRNNTRVPEC